MSLVGLLDKIQLREELWRELSLVWRMCSAMSAEKRETLDHTTTIANMCQLCSHAGGTGTKLAHIRNCSCVIQGLPLFGRHSRTHPPNQRQLSPQLLAKLYLVQQANKAHKSSFLGLSP